MNTNQTQTTTLSPDQQAIATRIAQSSDNFFVTGKAGTGKSYLLAYLKAFLPKKVMVVAPTGVAALVVGGQTIHSLFQLPPTLIEPDAIRLNKNTKEILSKVEVLIIDEISMVRADLMDAIDISLRQAKHSRLPFGGTQIVMFGDPYQLPPIIREPEHQTFFKTEYEGAYFFHAHVWKRAPFITLELSTIFRQKETELIEVLNSIRSGNTTSAHLDVLNRRVGMFEEDENALTLTATNRRSNQINNYFLSQLPSSTYSFSATINGRLEPSMYPAEAQLIIKPGAQVMMLKNDKEKRWVNGSLGKIVSATKKSAVVMIDSEKFEVSAEQWNRIRYTFNKESGQLEEEIVSTFTQLPLRLAWAVTIHKSQGQTFDKVTIDLEQGAFAHGQTYVALSRCRSLSGLSLSRNVTKKDIIVDPVIVDFMTGKYLPSGQLF